jgi:hypothetical protein
LKGHFNSRCSSKAMVLLPHPDTPISKRTVSVTSLAAVTSLTSRVEFGADDGMVGRDGIAINILH